MISRLLFSVLRNSIYVIVSLIFIIVIFTVNSSFDISQGNILNLLYGLSASLVISSLFMSGIGNIVKKISVDDQSTTSDFILGIRHYFFRVLSFNLLVGLIVLFIGSVAVSVFKPIILMGGIPKTITKIIISILISPFFVLWYPAMIIDNIGIIDSIKKAIVKGRRVYLKLVLCIFISLCPFIFYLGYINVIGLNSLIGYYLVNGIAFVISLFSLQYLFNIYRNDDTRVA